MDKILDRAARVVEERGWCRGVYETPAGRVCASRAITCAQVELGMSAEDRMQARERFIQYTGFNCIAGWNDKKKQTKEAVIAALEEASATLDL